MNTFSVFRLISTPSLTANIRFLNFHCIAAERKALAKSWFPDTDADAGQVIYTVIYEVIHEVRPYRMIFTFHRMAFVFGMHDIN